MQVTVTIKTLCVKKDDKYCKIFMNKNSQFTSTEA